MFPKVETVFSVNGVKRPFEGSGNKAARAARRSVPNKPNIKLEGFNIDGRFVKADLTSSQYNTRHA